MGDMRSIEPNTVEPGYYDNDVAEQEAVEYEMSVLLDSPEWVAELDLYDGNEKEMDQAMFLIASGDYNAGGDIIFPIIERLAKKTAHEIVADPEYGSEY